MPAPGSPQQLVEHIPGLRRYARALTGDRWAADDLVQDTLERACSRWRLWLAGSDLRGWLFTLMHNLFVDGLRQARRRPAGDDSGLAGLSAPTEPPGRLLDLQRCLMRLPEEQREVLLLVTLEDLSYAEVARITGTPVGTVMSRLSRARARLRELMEDNDSPGAAADGRPALRRMK